MQEVFEKIMHEIEILQKDKYVFHSDICNALHEVKDTITQVAEEYNNGWIPVSERLPEEHELYDITFENDAGIHSDSAIYEPFSGNWYWDDDETEFIEGEVLAWAEKREPYQPK